MSEQRTKGPERAERVSNLSPERQALLTMLLKKKAREVAPLRAIPRRREASACPLSFAQQRLWFLNDLEPGNPFYNVRQAVRLRGPLDVPVLKRSLEEVVRRHESLRTSFTSADGRPVQVVSAPQTLALTVIDLCAMEELKRETAVRWISGEEGVRPFDLTTSPLLRVALLRMSEEEHVVLLTMHHIVGDGWSMGVLVREVSSLYAAYSAGLPSPLAELPIQYADYAAWQREWLTDEVLESQLAYWKGQLADLPVLQLPTDFERPAVQSYRGARHSFSLGAELSDRLRELSRREGATLFTTLLAGFQLLLCRYSGQEEVVVGTDTANRNRAEIEGLIGFFINQLVLRTDLSGDPTFAELLARVRRVVFDAQAHQDLPFEKLVEELRPERSLSRSPLFQVKLVFQPAQSATLALPGLSVTPVGIDSAKANFDLTLVLMDTPAGVVGSLEYSTDLFKRDTVERMAGHFRALLESAAASPSAKLSRLEMLTGEERRRLLFDFNDTARPLPEGVACAHQLFERQVDLTPDAPALVDAGRTVTYAELDERANKLARYLRGLGVGPEAKVGLCAGRGAELVVGLLGILKAGGAYVALDPAYPLERLRWMMEDAGAWVLVTTEVEAERMPAGWAAVISIDGQWEEIGREDGSRLEGGAAGESLAYVVYTSGSTGRPKGVMLRHAGLVNLIEAQRRAFGVGAGGRVLQFASLSFDASISEIGMTICSGATLYLAPREELAPVEPLLSFLKEHAITVVTLPPTALSVMSQHNLTDLKTLISAGEAIPPEVMRRWAAGRNFFNAYGPTEITVCATIGACDEDDEYPTIGTPMDNTGVYLLDRNMSPVPVGVDGELYVTGVGLARGYLSRPGLTAERFLPDLFSPKPGARMYRTGDLGRRLADGRLLFLGRNDAQVKVRGFRVELGEVEAALARHPSVAQAAVVASSPEPGTPARLFAYYVVAEGAEAPSPEGLRSFLRSRLPDYMLPASFTRLDRMPLTASGKVDRKALPPPDGSRPETTSAYAEPRTRAERVLARIWGEVLGVERVGLHDNFFELGGDSIISIQAVSRANRAGLRLTTRQLFQHQTVAELAAAAEAEPAREVEAEQGEVAGGAPLTPIQRWFFGYQEVDMHHYNQSVLLRGRGRLEARAMSAAVEGLLRQHDALRLWFRRDEAGEWRQEVSSWEECAGRAFTTVDLTALPAEKASRAIEEAAGQAQRGFALDAGPLLRVVLFELGGEEASRLLAIGHHLAVDGVSWRVLLDDLRAGYEQALAGEPVNLGAKTTSFKRWAEELERYAASEELAGEADYWLGVGEGCSALPRSGVGGDDSVADARTASVSLTAEETRALLQEVPAAYRTQVNDALLAALAEALCKWGGAERVLVDLEGHGREELFEGLDVTRTVGWFTSSYPVALERRGDAAATLKLMKERLRGVPGGGVGYGVLKYMGEWEAAEALRSRRRAQVSFNYLGQFDQALGGGSAGGGERGALFEPAGESKGASRSGRLRRTHELEVNAAVMGGRLHVTWDYSPALHMPAEVEALAEAYAEALRGIVAHCRGGGCGYTPSDFVLAGLGQEELDGLFGGVRGVEDIYPLTPMQEGMLFHSLYEPEAGAYIAQTSYRLEGDFDVEAFRRAWGHALRRHAVLRTRFVWEGVRRPLQVVMREAELPLTVEDWRDLSEGEREERLGLLVRSDRARPFDPAQAPLLRLTAVRAGEGSWRVVSSFSHLLADGWSWPVVMRDVFRGYAAYARGGEPEMEAAPAPYREYIAWLGGRPEGEDEAYWRGRLKGFRAPTQLGLDHSPPRPVEGGRLYDHRQLRLSAELTAALQNVARKQQLTLNTLMQGAWAFLLSRYSGEDDVIFGVTVSGRPAELDGAETMVGMFINTLPLRTRVAGDERLLPWLKRLQEEQVELRQYEYSRLVDVQGWSEVPRGTSLFESILVYEKYPVPVETAAREGAESVEVGDLQTSENTHYPLTVEVAGSTRLLLRVGYDCRRFDDETVVRILSHFETVLSQMAARPDRRLRDLEYLPEAERSLVLEGWNQTATDDRLDVVFNQLFEEQAARTPARVAAWCEGQSLTYEELNRRADAVARYLSDADVGPDSVVGLLAERGLEFLAAVIGVFKAGGAYLPLDPLHPEMRLAQIVEQSRPAHLLATREFGRSLGRALELLSPEARPPLSFVEEVLESGRAGAAAPPRVNCPRHLAYVIYTSGSTGLPKGAMVEHRGMLNHLYAKINDLGLGAEDVVAQTASQCFDISVWQFLAALLVGGQVRVFRDEVAHDPPRLLREVEAEGVTILETVPSLLVSMLDEETRRGERRCALARLRWLIPTGEALPPEVCRQWLSLNPGIPMLNAYGPTECSDDVTHHVIAEPPPPHVTRVPIGRPVDNTRIYILDGRLAPVGVGVAGELCVGGVGVGRGYLRDEARTCEVFVPDPFAGRDGARMYRTGDLARHLSDGRIEFLGRRDHQVKLHGFRIELGEIEAALSAHDAVAQAVVLAREDAPGEKRLVAYFVPAEGGEAEAAELRDFLRRRVPAYMVPSAFVSLDSLPLTPNGKLDRRALPAPEAQAEDGAAFAAPLRPVEEVLAGIWMDVLRVKRVGAQDNFFELGGQSLLATQVVSRVREIFRVELPLRAIFETQTLAELAARVEEARLSLGGQEMPPLLPVGRDRELPLSFAQQRLWFMNQLEPDNPFYNISRAARIRGGLNVAALSRSLAEIARRHEVLRTTFDFIGGRPVQVINEGVTIDLPTIDLGDLPEAEREELVRRMASEEARRPFNLATGPVLRVMLARLAVEDHVVMFTMHHIASDGWSMGLLLREFTALYEAFTKGEASPLEGLPVQYADYAVWQREHLSGEVLGEQLRYWRERLGGGAAPVLALPTDRPRPVVQNFSGASELFVLSEELSDALRELSRGEGATLYMTLLAAYQALLYRYTGQEDVWVGTPVAGRVRRELEGLIGFFVNTLVLRTQVGGGESFRVLLGRVREVCLGAYAHQDVPFEKLVEELQPERTTTHSPFFQVLFVLQNAGRESAGLSELQVSSLEAETGTSKFDVTLMMSDTGKALRGGFQYNTDLFDRASIVRMVEHFKALLGVVVSDPQRRVSTLPLTDESLRGRLIEGFNDDPEELEEAGAAAERHV